MDDAPGDTGPGKAPTGARAAATQLVPPWLVNLAAVGWRVLAVAGLVVVLLRDGTRLGERLIGRARPGIAAGVRGASTRAVEVLGGYMGGTAVISFVGAASQLVIMVLLGLPLVVPVFILSFFLCFIPYIGGFISTGLALLIAVRAGSTSDIVVMAGWTLVFNIVTGNVVGPLMYQRTVHIHPAVVLVAIPAAGAIAGVIGVFIVAPAIGVVAAIWRTVIAVMNADGDPGPSIVPPDTPAS